MEEIVEVGADLLLAPHSILARPDLTKLLDSHRVSSVIEASMSRTTLHLSPKIQQTHLKVPTGGLDSSAFTSMSKIPVGGRQLVVSSDGLGTGALLCAARLVKVKGITVEKALAEVTSARRCNVPAGLRYMTDVISYSPFNHTTLSLAGCNLKIGRLRRHLQCYQQLPSSPSLPPGSPSLSSASCSTSPGGS